jgi:hypothetical protein
MLHQGCGQKLLSKKLQQNEVNTQYIYTHDQIDSRQSDVGEGPGEGGITKQRRYDTNMGGGTCAAKKKSVVNEKREYTWVNLVNDLVVTVVV